MGWPQWAVIVIYGLDIVYIAWLHNTPRPNYNWFASSFAIGITVWLLWMGGFFS